jgi:hypothetical protein
MVVHRMVELASVPKFADPVTGVERTGGRSLQGSKVNENSAH